MMIMVVGWSALAQVYAGGCMLEYSWGVCQGLCGEWNSQNKSSRRTRYLVLAHREEKVAWLIIYRLSYTIFLATLLLSKLVVHWQCGNFQQSHLDRTNLKD